MRRILCVHDGPAVLEALGRALLQHEHDWDVRLCTDMTSANAELAGGCPDVVCAAVNPPAIDGIVLRTRVRDRSPETIRIALARSTRKRSCARCSARWASCPRCLAFTPS